MIDRVLLRGKRADYTRLLAINCVAARGLLPTTAQSAGGALLAELVRNGQADRPLVVNASGVTTLEDYSLQSVAEALRATKRPLLVTDADAINEHLLRHLAPAGAKVTATDDAIPHHAFGWHPSQDEAQSLIREAAETEELFLTDQVRACYTPFPRMARLASTPLLATGVFDAGVILSDPKAFLWTATLLAERVNKWLADLPVDAPTTALQPFRVLAVSLRGSALAGAVGLLCAGHDGIEIVDHVGPLYEILEEYDVADRGVPVHYVLIADFIVGGTELRIAQSFARRKHSHLAAAVTVGCLLEPEAYRVRTRIEPLVRLSKVVPDARFQVQ